MSIIYHILRKEILFVSLFLVLACGEKKEAETPPNVILIMSDDQGWGDLSINGNENISTPNIDRIGKEGVVFDRFYVSPVCSPTRAELLTGRYHPRGGVYSTSAGGERLDLDEITIAQYFKDAGYRTAAYGKWHNGMQYPYHPNARGFDDFYGFCSGHWGNYFDPMLEHNGEIVKGSGFMVDDLTDHALDFIDADDQQPFFIYLPLNTPHSPMQVPDTFWQKFAETDLAFLYPDTTKENLTHTRAALAMCENIDWNVGRILDKLEKKQLDDNTIILYLSDNGPNGWRWNGGMKGRKGSTDEGGVRSPLMMRWSGKLEGGKVFNPIAAAIDILPTLMAMTSPTTEFKNRIDGINLWHHIDQDLPYTEERFIFNHWRNRTSVRSQRYRLDHQGHLFDMVEDPGQTNDVAANKPQILEMMKDKKAQWESTVLEELPDDDLRSFPLGSQDYTYTQIPARDGTPHGNIVRSNRFPNCTYFTQWTSLEDSITWPIEVMADGKYRVEVYYTCPDSAVGSVFSVSINDSEITGQITAGHNPPEYGMEDDRDRRQESYVKDFRPLSIGTMDLKEGKGNLVVKAQEIPGASVMDLRLLMFYRM